MFVYLRHANKAYANGKGPNGYPAHDPDLIEGEQEKCITTAHQLIQEYGIPERILSCSPLLCARRTAQFLAQSVTEFTDITPIIYTDPNLAEYLGNQKHFDYPDVMPETRIPGLPLTTESILELTQRTKHHVLDVHCLSRDDTRNIVWVVTHAFVMAHLILNFHIEDFQMSNDIFPYFTREKFLLSPGLQ